MPQIPLPDKNEDKALATAAELEVSLERLTEALQGVVSWKQKVFKWAVTAVIVAVLALGGLGYAVWRVHQSQLVNCTSNNILRTANRSLWFHIIQLSSASPPAGETPEQRKVREEQSQDLLGYVNRQFAPVDCSALYPWF